jgi:hypothetical protein
MWKGLMNELVSYSLWLPPAVPRQDLLRQLVTSLQTLRAHNGEIPVCVFVYGDIPSELSLELSRYDASVIAQGSYESRLAKYSPEGWPVLMEYPVLHKLLNFDELAGMGAERVLALDCDTLFFGDVQVLFDRYAESDCYAREEPSCRRSQYGYDRAYLNEEALEQLGLFLGLHVPRPFNVGVMLFNHHLCSRLARLQQQFVTYAWRFLLWLAANPSNVRRAYGEGDAVVRLRGMLRTSNAEFEQAIPYPSANEWILDEMALWLTLGHVADLRCNDFSPCHVPQNGELLDRAVPDCDWIVGHYFTQNMTRVEDWLQGAVV